MMKSSSRQASAQYLLKKSYATPVAGAKRKDPVVTANKIFNRKKYLTTTASQ